MAQLYEQNLTQWLQLSGENIVQNRPQEERVPWILFLIDEMNQFMSPEESEALLVDLRTAINDRLVKASS